MGRALVTGASSGLGLELAKLLDEQGHEVIVVARSAAALEALAATMSSPTIIAADLATADGRRTVTDAVGSVDILVNNAGFGECGPFAEIAEERSVSMVELNCEAVVSLTRSYLPGMLERGTGKVMNIASTAAFQPGPTMAVYYASKAFVLSFTEAIAEETRGSGVSVTAFCPGAFASGFQDAAHAGNTRLIKGRSPSRHDRRRTGSACGHGPRPGGPCPRIREQGDRGLTALHATTGDASYCALHPRRGLSLDSGEAMRGSDGRSPARGGG